MRWVDSGCSKVIGTVIQYSVNVTLVECRCMVAIHSRIGVFQFLTGNLPVSSRDSEFHRGFREALEDDRLRRNFRSTMDRQRVKRQKAFPDSTSFELLCSLAAWIRKDALARLPDLLEQLEQNCTRNGM
ncbi:MAG: hypothetical protein GY703_05030 [Gammaproteobacteria bacterium]|nr:hypothetical protein [Gammaproteobacteria bacterium]